MLLIIFRALLPNPRLVSFSVFPTVSKPDRRFSQLFVQYGQFLDHDIALSPELEMEDDCCNFPEQDGCFPIYVPCNDPHFLLPENKPRQTRSVTQNRKVGSLFEGQGIRSKSGKMRKVRGDRQGVMKRVVKKTMEVAKEKGTNPVMMMAKNFPFINSNQLMNYALKGIGTSNRNSVSKQTGSISQTLNKRLEAELKAKGISTLNQYPNGTLKTIPINRQAKFKAPFQLKLPQGSPDNRGPQNPEYCLEFRRSIPFCEDISINREQMNGVTAFIDGSNIYGSEFSISRQLREFEHGFLKGLSAGRSLPKVEGKSVSGDPRALEMPGLASMHTLWLREHNRIAEAMATLCCNGNDEEIFQRTRRILIAEMQNIVFSQFLPQVSNYHFSKKTDQNY